MLEYTKGNLLDADVEALVNTVNEVGVMGKGIALMFKERFPTASESYMRACKAGDVHVGKVLVTRSEELFPKWIIHFPTKKHWRNRSKIEWIRDGLADLVLKVRKLGITSIAIPPLGCGNGGLDWADVRPLIEEAFAPLAGVEVMVYEPTVVYQNKPKSKGVRELTAARALVAELVRRYSSMGLDCTLLEVHKLAYFLQVRIAAAGLPDPLDLRFSANRYGPYADRLRHLLNALDGSYLHSAKRINDASPYDHVWFNHTERSEVESYLANEAQEYEDALASTESLIDGFESPLGIELLATVHWIVARMDVEPELKAIRARLQSWPGGKDAGERKLALFDDRLLSLALDRVTESPSSPVGT